MLEQQGSASVRYQREWPLQAKSDHLVGYNRELVGAGNQGLTHMSPAFDAKATETSHQQKPRWPTARKYIWTASNATR